MVTRSALQNAASIAKNILTTEAIVAEPAEDGRRRHARRYAGHGRHDVRILSHRGRFQPFRPESGFEEPGSTSVGRALLVPGVGRGGRQAAAMDSLTRIPRSGLGAAALLLAALAGALVLVGSIGTWVKSDAATSASAASTRTARS